MRKTRFSSSSLLVMVRVAGLVSFSSVAEAGKTTAGGGASASGDGSGGEITASVTVEYVTAGSGGDGGGVTSSSSQTVTVDPVCRYVHFMSPAELAAKGGAKARGAAGDTGGLLSP